MERVFRLNKTSKWRIHIHVVIHYSQIFRLILLSHSSLTKTEEKETVFIGDKEREKQRRSPRKKRSIFSRSNKNDSEKKERENSLAPSHKISVTSP